MLVDAAHNPHGARALASRPCASRSTSTNGESCSGVLADKDAEGIVAALAPVAAHVFATAPDSDRAERRRRASPTSPRPPGSRVTVHADVADAADAAREWAAASARRAVVIAGSVVLAGEAVALATAEDWKSGWDA